LAPQEGTFQNDRLALAGHRWLQEGESAPHHLVIWPPLPRAGPMTAVKDQVTG
jgi:hypothetical protein